MRWLKLAFGILVGLVMMGSPRLALAEEFYPTDAEIQEGQRFTPTEEQVRSGEEETSSIVTYSDFWSYVGYLARAGFGGTTLQNLRISMAVVAEGAAISVVLVFMWWGVRKATRMLFAGFRKGKMSA